MTEWEFPLLRATAENSLIGRAAASTVKVTTSAAATSQVANWLHAGRAGFRALPPARRLRAGAMMLGWAAMVHWVLLAVIPAYVATGIPRAWFLGLAVAAWLIAANAAFVARVWPGSALSRGLRWMVT